MWMGGMWELGFFEKKIDSSEVMWLQHTMLKNQEVLLRIIELEEDEWELELERTYVKINSRY